MLRGTYLALEEVIEIKSFDSHIHLKLGHYIKNKALRILNHNIPN